MLKRLDCRAQRDSQVINVEKREVTEAVLAGFQIGISSYDDLEATALFYCLLLTTVLLCWKNPETTQLR